MNLSYFIKTSAWAILPALLLLFAQWLANTMTQKDIALNYKILTRTVSNIHTSYIEITNHSEVAIDKVIISSNPPDIILAAYEPVANSGNNNTWEGEILAGQSLRILYVLNKEMPISVSALNSLLTAEYKKRNKETGRLEWMKVNLREDSIITSGTVAYLLWFFSPFLVVLIISVIVNYGLKYFRSKTSKP